MQGALHEETGRTQKTFFRGLHGRRQSNKATPQEKEKFAAQLGQILGYFEKLSKVNVDGVEPSAHAHAIYNVWREDEEGPTLTPEQAMLNAPKKRDNQIVVPKVVDEA